MRYWSQFCMDSCRDIPTVRPTYHCNESSSRTSHSPFSTLLLTLPYEPYLVHLTLNYVAAEAVPRPFEHSRAVSQLPQSASEYSRSVSHALYVFYRSSPALQRSRLQFHRLRVIVVSLSLFYHQSRYYLLASSAQTLRPCLFLSSRHALERDFPAAAVLADAFLYRYPVEAS